MPDNSDIIERIDSLEDRVDCRLKDVNDQIGKLHDVMIKIAEQQKDIDHLHTAMAEIRKVYAEETDCRVKALELIHAGCQINIVAKDIHRLWAAIGAFVLLFIGVAVDRFWVKQ